MWVRIEKRVQLAQIAAGVPGPVTVSVWQGRTTLQCIGTSSVTGSAKAYFALRSGRECTVKWHLSGEGLRSRELRLPQDRPGNGVEVLLGK